MSVSSILLDPENPSAEPEIWSDLNVNSIKTKSFNFSSGIASGQSNVYLDSTSGLDTNTGLSAGSPVLTLRKAIEVALSSASSAAELVINLAGSANIDFGLDDSTLPDFQKQLDLSQLCAKYSLIKFYGSFAAGTTLTIPAAGSTAAAWGNFNRFTRYTYSGAETNPIAYDGQAAATYIPNKDKPSYRGAIRGSLGGNTLDVAAPNDGMEAEEWIVGRIGGPVLLSEYSVAIISKCPVYFERCYLRSSSTNNRALTNLTGGPIAFYGSHLDCKNTSGFLSYGEWLLEGSTVGGSGYILNDDKAKVALNYCLLYGNLKEENEFSINYVYGFNSTLELLAASGNLDSTYVETGYNYPANLLHVSGSNARLNDVKFVHYGSDAAFAAVYAEDSILSINNGTLQRFQVSDTVGTANVVNLFNSNVSFEGSDIQMSTGAVSHGHAVVANTSRIAMRGETSGIRTVRSYESNFLLNGSQLVIDPITTAASDSFVSTNAQVAFIHNSNVDLPDEAFAIASPAVSFKLQGISQLTVEGAVAFANAGPGTSDLYQLGALAAGKSFVAGYQYYQSDAGFCQLDVRVI